MLSVISVVHVVAKEFIEKKSSIVPFIDEGCKVERYK